MGDSEQVDDQTFSGLLHDGTYRAHWLRVIIGTSQITDSIRVLLLTLGLHMDASGRVSVPRDVLVALLGRNERKVAEKVRTALDSGFLVQTARGQKGQTAVYRAAIGGQPLSLPPGGHPDGSLSMSPGGHPEPNFSMAPGGQADDFQGADFKHPESSQGADFRMAPGGQAEPVQGAPRGTSQFFIGVDVVEEVDPSDGSLFDLSRAASRRATQKPKKPGKSRRKPETPIPADFTVTADMRAEAHAKGYTVDLDRQAIRFINHAHQNDRRCRDWTAAWRNWIDKAQEIHDTEAAKNLRPTGTNGANGWKPFQNPVNQDEYDEDL